MLKHNSYFEGKVQSVEFERNGRRTTAGVIDRPARAAVHPWRGIRCRWRTSELVVDALCRAERE